MKAFQCTTVLFLGTLVTGPMPPQAAAGAGANISREDIEWLDVWLPHTNDAQLPRVLLIGDSITRGYYPDVEKALGTRAYVGRLSTSKSLGDPALIKEIELTLSEQSYQAIHFNNWLHGSGYSEKKYAQALDQVLAVLRRYAPRACIVWASTTDLAKGFQGDHPSMARVIERNRIAAGWATANGIPIDDLFSIAAQHAEYHVPDGVHFTPQGNAALAAQVAKTIGACLAKSEKR